MVRFGPRDRRRLFGVWSASQAVLIGLSAALAVALVRSHHGRGAVAGAAAEVVAAAVVATWTLRGRTLLEWFPALARYAITVAGGARRQPAPTAKRPRGSRSLRPLVRINLEGVPTELGAIGVVWDRREHRLSAALEWRGDASWLADAAGRSQRAAAWASLLDAVADGAAAGLRIGWVERTSPDSGAAILDAMASAGREGPAGVAAGTYRAFVAQEVASALRHESLLVVSVPASGRAPNEDVAALMEATRAIERRGREAGLALAGALGPQALARFFATSSTSAPARASVAPLLPLGVEEEWGALRTDGTWHATSWIAEWPRAEVGPDFLAPLLLQGDVRRTLAVVFEAVPPEAARRRTERARTAKAADHDLRRRHGFATTARDERERDAVLQREAELASGHGAYRFAGFVSVTAPSEAVLEADVSRVERAAAASHLVLRRLYGSQREAFSYVLPLARGL